MKKTTVTVGIILLLLGLRGAVGMVSLAVKFGPKPQLISTMVTGSVTALSLLTCGAMLTARRSLKNTCTVLGGFLVSMGVYDIIAACISIPQLNALMSKPDSQLPGLNSMYASLGLLSVGLMFAEAALYILGAAFGIAFMRKGKLFIPAVIFLILPIIFLTFADKGNGRLVWLLFLAAVIYTKKAAAPINEKIESTEPAAGE